VHDLHERWPAYGFDGHKGYPTPAHLQALRAHGPCPEHRRSFAPVRQADPR
jgi:ribonuclease HII